jgi:hypothetical protein
MSNKIKLGACSHMTSHKARARAEQLLGEIKSGIDPRPKSDAALAKRRGRLKAATRLPKDFLRRKNDARALTNPISIF